MTNLRAVLILIMVIVCSASSAEPHEMRPAYLEIRETSPDTYDVLWKVPARGDSERLGLYLRFGPGVDTIGEPVSGFMGDSHVQRMRISRPGGLTGTPITIDGLARTFTDVLLRIERIDGVEITRRLTPDQPTYMVESDPGLWQVAWAYLVLGVDHILLGIDHLLFVLALLLVVSGRKKLISTVTAFTLAHSITLALATLGFVHVPGAPVEAVIALSIVFVAAEIIHGCQGRTGLTARAPWVVAFSFGLLHGFGFAGALSEVGLPQRAIPLALLTFNVGVEVGQMVFIGAVGLVSLGLRLIRVPLRWVPAPLAYGIGGMASFWLIERIARF